MQQLHPTWLYKRNAIAPQVTLSDEIIFFDDVAGNEQAKVELMEVVDFFRRPEKFRSSGARAPKGVLLVGPPGALALCWLDTLYLCF